MEDRHTPFTEENFRRPEPAVDGSGGTRRVQVLLVHGNHALRRAWRDAISLLPGPCSVKEAGDANQALHVLPTVTLDVAIVDMSSPGISGIELARQIIRRQPTVSIIVCGRTLEPSVILEAFRAGARCYLTGDSVDDVVKAVASLSRGGSYFTENVRSLLTDIFLEEYVMRLRHRAVGSRYSNLTSREGEVLQKLIAGRTSKEIARDLAISVNTVDTHRARIMQKLNVHSLTELTKYALLDSEE